VCVVACDRGTRFATPGQRLIVEGGEITLGELLDSSRQRLRHLQDAAKQARKERRRRLKQLEQSQQHEGVDKGSTLLPDDSSTGLPAATDLQSAVSEGLGQKKTDVPRGSLLRELGDGALAQNIPWYQTWSPSLAAGVGISIAVICGVYYQRLQRH